MFLFIPVSHSATYKIRNGNVVNPNGRVKTNTSVSTQITEQKSNTYYNNDDDVKFTKTNDYNQQTETDSSVQKTVNNVTTDSPKQRVEIFKKENETYLKEPPQKVNYDEIMAKYSRDPYANEHKTAIENNKNTHKDCEITTWSGYNEYGIWCKSNPNYGYYYESINNPILTRFERIKEINSSKEIYYTYVKESEKWYFKGVAITIKENKHDYQFIYVKNFSGYKLKGYYIDDILYDANGKYEHTRTVKNF